MEQSNSAVNQSSAVSAFPVVASQRPAGNKKLRPINISKRGLLLLLAVAVIFLIVIFFVFGIYNQQQKPQKQAQKVLFDSSKITFSSSLLKDNFEGNLGQFVSAADKTEKGKSLIRAFLALSKDYTVKPAEEKRQLLLKMYGFFKGNYPQEFAKADLIVPCFEAVCGVAVGDSFLKIEKAIGENKDLDDSQKQSIYYDLHVAGAAQAQNNKVLAINDLYAAFSKLKSVRVTNKSEGIKVIMQDVLALMKAVEPAMYNQLNKKDIAL